MSKVITLDGLRDYLTNLKRLFVTKTDAESTYETKANAANIYETKEDAATHLTKTEASETYITKADAADTYATKSEIIVHDGPEAQRVFDIWPDGPEAHNAMWGGRDITAAFNNGTFSTNVDNGTFKDIFPGDYITKQVTIPRVLADDGTTVLFDGGTYTVNWVIADCDYWWHKDENYGMEIHHVVIVPQTPIFDAEMNVTNTTKGGYAGSEMYKNVIYACARGIENAFGSDHILTFGDLLTTDLNTSAVPSGITTWTGAPNWNGSWYTQECSLMSEAMVYDGPHCASSALDNAMATRQMSAFRLSSRLINYNCQRWWLRDVVSSTGFATVSGYGNADTLDAPDGGGVRPFALLV